MRFSSSSCILLLALLFAPTPEGSRFGENTIFRLAPLPGAGEIPAGASATRPTTDHHHHHVYDRVRLPEEDEDVVDLLSDGTTSEACFSDGGKRESGEDFFPLKDAGDESPAVTREQLARLLEALQGRFRGWGASSDADAPAASSVCSDCVVEEHLTALAFELLDVHFEELSDRELAGELETFCSSVTQDLGRRIEKGFQRIGLRLLTLLTRYLLDNRSESDGGEEYSSADVVEAGAGVASGGAGNWRTGETGTGGLGPRELGEREVPETSLLQRRRNPGDGNPGDTIHRDANRGMGETGAGGPGRRDEPGEREVVAETNLLQRRRGRDCDHYYYCWDTGDATTTVPMRLPGGWSVIHALECGSCSFCSSVVPKTTLLQRRRDACYTGAMSLDDWDRAFGRLLGQLFRFGPSWVSWTGAQSSLGNFSGDLNLLPAFQAAALQFSSAYAMPLLFELRRFQNFVGAETAQGLHDHGFLLQCLIEAHLEDRGTIVPQRTLSVLQASFQSLIPVEDESIRGDLWSMILGDNARLDNGFGEEEDDTQRPRSTIEATLRKLLDWAEPEPGENLEFIRDEQPTRASSSSSSHSAGAFASSSSHSAGASSSFCDVDVASLQFVHSSYPLRPPPTTLALPFSGRGYWESVPLSCAFLSRGAKIPSTLLWPVRPTEQQVELDRHCL